MFKSVCSRISSLVLASNNVSILPARCISVTAARPVKEVVERREGKTLIIEAKVTESNRFKRLFNPGHKNGACPLCALGLDVKHTDVLILEQFMRRNGTMLPRAYTGLCKWQQRKVGFMIAMALQSGLMPNYGIGHARLDTDWFPRFRKYNSYFDEDTIRRSKKECSEKRKEKLEYAAKLAMAEELQ